MAIHDKDDTGTEGDRVGKRPETMEIDATTINIDIDIVHDVDERKDISRPSIVVEVNRYTGEVVAVRATVDPLMSLFDFAMDLMKGPDGMWWGVPEMIVVDNGQEWSGSGIHHGLGVANGRPDCIVSPQPNNIVVELLCGTGGIDGI